MKILISDILAAPYSIDHSFLDSPQYMDTALSEALGTNIILKNETKNLIRCFKGRGSEVYLSKFCTVISELICASAGNFGIAMAFSCQKRGIKLTVYASLSTSATKIKMIKEFGAAVILYGNDFDEAKLEAKRVAHQNGIHYVEDGFDIEIAVGAATIGMEIIKEFNNFDYALIALGNGALLNGLGTIFRKFCPRVKLFAVQAKAAPAMLESWRRKKLVQSLDVIQALMVLQ